LNLNNIGKDFLLSLETKGIKLGLKRTKQLFQVCGNPEKDLDSIQIIGTNGKGSTAATLSNILCESGIKVGLYTSPHLVDLSERIQINNNPIDNTFINHFIDLFSADIELLGCTFFETLTAMAAYYFKNQGVEVAIFETGLGGKFDSVTACNSKLQLFTKISMDHSHILGDSIDKIATDKSCAMHSNSICYSVQQDNNVNQILIDKAKEKSAEINFTLENYNDNIIPSLFGNHQIENTRLAITAAKHFINLSVNNISKSISNVHWPGRVELLQQNPSVYFDVSHNDDSIQAFCKAIESLNHINKKTLIISIQKTKIITDSIPQLENIFSKIIITSLNDRMYSTDSLSSMFSNKTQIEISTNPDKAIKNTMMNIAENELLAIIGSHYWGEYIYNNF
tara:strand:+ start:517 stop:1701 length:1185 start_codon:yes stop_codon:yes gene_type:complete